MNVLIISRNSPYESIGGIERHISNLISFYKEQNEINLFIMLPNQEKNYTKKEEDVTILFRNSLFLSRTVQATGKEISEKAKIFSEDVRKILDEHKIDIICAENFHTDLPAAYSLLLTMVTMSKNIPVVLQIHSFAATELQTELINQLKWDKISCVSKSVAGDCFQKGTDIDLITTHYLGIDNNKFNLSEKTNQDLGELSKLKTENKIILTATRIIRGKRNILQEKGIINLLQAFSKISPRYPNLKLVIAIGKPPENLNTEFNVTLEMLEGYVKLHNIEKQTILKTFQLDEMPEVYKYADVFVLASENETFGQVFIEAMASGIPVIGTKVGGIPEIISDSYNGFLIPPDDSSILAQRIETLLNDPSLKNKFIKAGVKTVESKFTSNKQLTNFNTSLNDLLQLN